MDIVFPVQYKTIVMKSVFALLTAGFIFFSFFDVNSHPTRQYKCCTRTDWEATIYGEGVGHTFDLGFLIWRNVTYRIAYSLSLNKCHSVFKTVGQLHPLLPIFTHFMITLDDYNKVGAFYFT